MIIEEDVYVLLQCILYGSLKKYNDVNVLKKLKYFIKKEIYITYT